MLVLSRQRDETIMIGDDVEITIVDVRGDKVRIGISAPTRVAVHRKEVYEAIQAENRQAARLAGQDLAGQELPSITHSNNPTRNGAPDKHATLLPRITSTPASTASMSATQTARQAG